MKLSWASILAIYAPVLPSALAESPVVQTANQQASFWKPLVTSYSLRRTLKLPALMKHAQALEDIAYASPYRNRLMGTQGHNDTVTYLYNQLTSPALRDYYNVTLQPWPGLVQISGTGSLLVDGVNKTVTVAQFSPSGQITAPFVIVANLGCNATDYPAAVAGKIALISRGTCQFREKSANAGRAGAAAAIIYNNIAGGIPGMTLGTDNSTGKAIPTLGISREDGLAIVQSITGGATVIGVFNVSTVIIDATTYNVLAETKSGEKDSVLVLGAHSDSVEAGPGINDDGSGTVGILEVAKQLTKYRVRNQVRFGFWSGEEEGLLGSTWYVDHLNAEEKANIKLYLNFDMIASPNYQFGIFDGDGGDFNITGPEGSGDIELLFEKYFESQDLNYTSIAFNGRSDYDPFIKAGIPAGGVETGAEGNKTVEGAEQFGGQAGVAFDINYHGPGDNVTNLNQYAFLVNTKAIAHGVATYARSFSSVHFNTTAEYEDDEREEGKRRAIYRRDKTTPSKIRWANNKTGYGKKIVRSNRYKNERWL